MTTRQRTGRRRAADDGFTLVELLIVIVILGILATVTVFAVRGITDRGQAAACASDQQVVSRAVEVYFAQNTATTLPATGAGTDRYEATLVSSGFLRDHSDLYDVAADGTLTPASGSPC